MEKPDPYTGHSIISIFSQFTAKKTLLTDKKPPTDAMAP